jgi:tetratricopeptide (TPR) repeat protein
LCILAIACFAAAPVHSQGPPQSSTSAVEQDFQAAMTAQDSGDLDRAETILLGLHNKHPGFFAVDESLGLLYVAQESYTRAVPLLETAVREQPSSDIAHANLGAAYFKLHRYAEALNELEHAARLNPRNPATQQSLGELLLEAGKPKLAVEAYTSALKEKPDDLDLELSCATALVAAGDAVKAEEILMKLAGADRSAAAQTLLGEIDEKKGNFQQAVRHFSRAVELEPSEQNAWALGVELLRHWTFDAAIREFEAGVAKFPQSIRMRLALGAAYFGDAKYAAALPIFSELLELDKENSVYAELLGMACTSVTESAKGRCNGLLTYAEAHPRDARASTYAAAMLLDETATENRVTLARKLLDHAIVADPKAPDAKYELGVLKQNQGDWMGSVSDLENAIALKPNLAQAHYRLGLAYWRTGRQQDGQMQMELQKKYSKQQKEDLEGRLRQITTFIVDVPK